MFQTVELVLLKKSIGPTNPDKQNLIERNVKSKIFANYKSSETIQHGIKIVQCKILSFNN